jgi:superfamily II DNA or RNA helicase
VNLRPYQSACVDSIFTQLQEKNSTLAVLPTGCGKTVIFSEVCRRWDSSRVLVVAHREELIVQAADKIEAVVGVRPEVEMGEYWASRETLIDKPHVVVTSVQTMSRASRQKGFDKDEFGLIIIDEAHHAPASSYRKVIDAFSPVKVLGVTATPDRTDEAALGQVFESVAYEYGVLDAINDGWLVPIEQEMIEVDGLDFSQIKTTAGDLNQGQLEEVMMEEDAIHRVAAPTIECAGDRPTLIFTVSVAHAHALANILKDRYGKTAASLDGTSDPETRRDVIQKFKSGNIQYLCNCGLFLEGFDAPNTAVVVMARPTKSRALYAQMLGRGTRPLPGVVDGWDTAGERQLMIEQSDKPSMLVLDFVGNSGRHKLISAADILGGNYSDEVIEKAKDEAKKSGGKRKNVLEQLADAEELLEEERRRERAKIKAKAEFKRQKVNPFDVLDFVPEREPGYFVGRPMTEGQRGYLERLGFGQADLRGVGFVQATAIIDKAIKRKQAGLCSIKQAKVLKRFGEPTEVTFADAKQIIDQIAANGWKPRERTEATGHSDESWALSAT